MLEKRTNAVSRLASLQYAGFAVTPIFGALVSSISSSMQFILPPLLLLLLILLSSILLFFIFDDILEGDEITAENNQPPPPHLPLSTTTLNDMYSINISTTSTSIITNGSEGDITNVISEDQHKDDVIVENDLSIVDEKNKCYIILKDMNNDNNNNNIYNNNIDNDKNHTDNNVNRIENNLIINNINNDNTNNNNNIITLGNKKLNLEYLQSLLSYNIYYILILNNITTRGTIVIYETQVSRILLDDYNLSIIDLGIIVSISGLVGTIQLIYFKELYTNNFRDIFLVISFSFIIAIAQLFILNWMKNIHIQLWAFCISVNLVYCFG